MKKFEIIEHTADVAIEAYGSTREELFANAALGMFTIIGDTDKVAPAESRLIEVHADGPELLLADFLAELLYQLDVSHFVLHHATVESVTDTDVRAMVYGEPLGPHHELFTDIKAVTHHRLKVERCDSGWRATVLFDI